MRSYRVTTPFKHRGTIVKPGAPYLADDDTAASLLAAGVIEPIPESADEVAERRAIEQADAVRIEAERHAAEQAEAERVEAERRAAEQTEADRTEAERRAAEQAEADRIEAERQAALRSSVLGIDDKQETETERPSTDQANAAASDDSDTSPKGTAKPASKASTKKRT